jgi:hypothetical protein
MPNRTRQPPGSIFPNSRGRWRREKKKKIEKGKKKRERRK